MVTSRVTHRSIQESTLAQMQGNLAAVAKLQQQISSGKRISQPSDDPTATVSALAVRQQLRVSEQYELAAQDGLSWLRVQDTALQTTSSQLTVARTRVVQALSSGSMTGGSRAAIAQEVDGIAQTVLAVANSQYQGRSVFAGTAGATAAVSATKATVPYSASGPTAFERPEYSWAAAGAAATTSPVSPGTWTPVSRQVDSTSTVNADTNGAAVFGTDVAGNGQAASKSVFSLLAEISQEIRVPNSTGPDTTTTVGGVTTTTTRLGALLGELDSRTGKVLEALSDVGARTNRIESARSNAADLKARLTEELSAAEDTDVPAAVITLSMQETAYRAAVQTSAKVLQTSLLDFLR